MSNRKVDVGRKVQVFYEAEIAEVYSDGKVAVRADDKAPGHWFVVHPGMFEVRDEPGLDPIGTVRICKAGTYIKQARDAGEDQWVDLYGDRRSDDGMTGDSNIIGRINLSKGRLETE